MKWTSLIICLIFSLACHSFTSKEKTLATLPPFEMLLMDSNTVLKAQEIPMGKPILLLFFRPDCPHCQRETRLLLDHMDSLKNVRIYFLATAPFKDIRDFYFSYHLDKQKNLTVGRDQEHSFYQAFRPASVPYTAIYDANKKLVKIFNEEAGIENILKAIRT
jgi:thiol-disulfide isomerase/thioredoxin